MDWQAAFNVVAGVAGLLGGWFMKLIADDLKETRDELRKIPETYARRDDVREMKQDIMAILERIENKVDTKHV